MRSLLPRSESVLLLGCGGLLTFALLAPPLAQPASYHAFADARALLGLPCFMDVTSNLGFLLAGLLGAWHLDRLPAGALSRRRHALAALFFTGLLLTALASSWYHLAPDDAGLAIDRAGMAFAFAGLLGLAAATRVSDRAGALLGVAVLLLAPWAILTWYTSGNILPWAALQGGGMALVLCLAIFPPQPAAPDIRWAWVIVAYAAAKLFEVNDLALYEWSSHLVSGHSVKHLVAALAALPVIAAVRRAGGLRHNAPGKASSPARGAGNA